MKNFLLLTLIVLCGLSVVGQTGKTSKTTNQKKTATKITPSSSVTVEEYAVYMAVLGKDRKHFVVRDKSGLMDLGTEADQISKENFEELKPETINDFRLKNKKSAELERRFPTKANYTLISDEEFAKILGGKLDYEAFFKKYPGSDGRFAFSRVGFSKDGTQALVFVTHNCGRLCGEGNYYFLKKENDEWKVISRQGAWIS